MPKKQDPKELERQQKIERLQAAALGLIASIDKTIVSDDPEGVFRISAAQAKINTNMGKIEKAETVNFDEMSQIERAALLKAVIRKMLAEGEPLFSYKQFEDLRLAKQKTIDLSTKGGQPYDLAKAAYNEKLRHFLKGTSDINQEIALSLFNMLHKAAANSTRSKMDESNLAVVFGPNLYEIPLDKVGETAKTVISLTEELIKHSSSLVKVAEEKKESLFTGGYRRLKNLVTGDSSATFLSSDASSSVVRAEATFYIPHEKGGVTTRVPEGNTSPTRAAKEKLHDIEGKSNSEDNEDSSFDSDDDSLQGPDH